MFSRALQMAASALASAARFAGARMHAPMMRGPQLPRCRAASTRDLWVQRAGASGSAKIATSATDVGDLLEDVMKKLPSLRAVDADRIRLRLAVKVAGGPDKLVTLDSMDTLDEALTKALGGSMKPDVKLLIVVDVETPPAAPAKPFSIVADPARLPARPVPISFEAAGFNDSTGSPMHVALVAGYPFYLDQLALLQVKDWASGEVNNNYATQKLVVLTGPIKCGKTTLLQLLPRLLSPDGRRKPVVLAHTFDILVGPHGAALNLVLAADTLAKQLGFEIFAIPTSGEDALENVARVLCRLAEGIAAAGGELILLLDEAQAPILAASSPADASYFAVKLKAIHAACRATSRIAITGSGMVSLLNSLRSLPPNGYALWGAMARVHLGATPAPAAARIMADAIIGFHSHAWPQAVKTLVTPDYVISKLSSPIAGAATAGTAALPLTAARPALVAFLVELLGSAAVGSADAVAGAALSELHRKLEEEATVDAAVALASLEEGQRKTVYWLAAGMLDRKTLEGRLGNNVRQRFTELLQTLCEPSRDPDAAVMLLPPYGALFTTILDAEGALLVEWTGGRWELNETLRGRLKFFGEH